MYASPNRDWLWMRLQGAGERTAMVSETGTLSYTAWCAEVSRWRERLTQAGLEAGEVVSLQADIADGLAPLIALWQMGTIVAPTSPSAIGAIDSREAICKANWRIVPSAETITRRETGPRPSLLEELVAKGESGLVLFSSGTSGEPKATVHSLDRLIASYKSRRPRAWSILTFLLFDHIGGLHTLLNALALTATMVVPHDREPSAVCAAMAEHRVNLLPTTPTFLNLLLLSEAWKGHDLAALRLITYGTEPMPEGLLKRVRHAFPRAKLLQTFGTSETGIAQTRSASSDSTLLRLEDTAYRIVEGELWLRSETRALGYLNASNEGFAEDGWYRTGDLAEELPGGYLRIHGRAGSLINVGGEKVLPAEVESALLNLPEIGACEVLGQPHPITGQTVVARVIPAPGYEGADLKRLIRRYARTQLPTYQVPTKVIVTEKLEATDRFKRGAPTA